MTDQTMLYKSGPANPELGGRKLVYRSFPDGEIKQAQADGWSLSPDEAENHTHEPSLLDQTAAQIIEALPAASKDELIAYLAAEKAGKTRKGVIAALEQALKDISDGA